MALAVVIILIIAYKLYIAKEGACGSYEQVVARSPIKAGPFVPSDQQAVKELSPAAMNAMGGVSGFNPKEYLTVKAGNSFQEIGDKELAVQVWTGA